MNETDTLTWSINAPQHLTEHQLNQINDFVALKSSCYIWNIQKLTFLRSMGSLHFGNAIEDLWFATNIIFQISKMYPDWIISIKDDDGEFLLIEASDHINDAYDPSNTEHRVWLKNGTIHLIPLEYDVESVHSALKIVRDPRFKTEFPELAQSEIEKKLSKFNTGKLPYSNIHLKTVQGLHPNVAKVLTSKPEYISNITHAFMEYIQIKINLEQLKTNISNNNISSQPQAGCSVTKRLKFTRLLYAQLVSVKLPLDEFNNDQDNLGMKLNIGYNIILHDNYTEINEILENPEDISEADLNIDDDDDRWMYISEESFPKQSTSNSDENDLNLNEAEREQFMKFEQLRSQFDQFSERKSDVRGVLPTDLNDSDDESSDSDLEPINLDADLYFKLLDGSCLANDTSQAEITEENCDAAIDAELRSKLEDMELLDDDQLDINLVKNIMESINMQEGAPGPSTTLFGDLRL